MASSGTISTAITSWLTLRVKWVANSQNVANNTTNLTVTAQLVTSGGHVNSSASKDISLTINGTKYTSTCTIGISQNSTKTLFTKTVNVTHNADGSKTCAIACALELDVTLSGKKYTDTSASGNATLNTIPRASTFARSGTATMGNAQTITITRASSSFTHKLYYTWSGTKTLIASSVGTSYTWTPLVSMAEKIPNAISGSCTLTCETYSGSTLIGTKTLSFTLSVPSSVEPTISALTLTEAVSGLAAQFGGFVNTKSKIKYAVTAAGAQGSTIKTYAVTIAGQKFSKQTATTAAITAGAGTKTATVTVTDSRGRKASKSVNYEVFAYSPPAFKLISADRCTADGVLDDEGTFVTFAVNVSISAVNNKNTALYILEYKLATEADSEYKEIERTTGAYTLNGSGVIPEIEFSTDVSYILRFSAIDYFTTTTPATKTLVVSTAKPTFDVYRDGDGFGIGKVAELKGVCDIGYKTRFFGGIMPLVLPDKADLNDYKNPNFFTSGAAAAVKEYVNCPVTAATFDLEVMEAGSEGQIKQRLTTCSKTASRVFERFYYQEAWGEWFCISDIGNTLLWSGEYYMSAAQTANLSEPISKQPNGIILIFSAYVDGKAENYWINSFFKSKYEVSKHNGAGNSFLITGGPEFDNIAAKYLYIYDNKITGNDKNKNTGTTNGITYVNNKYVLRYVVGV